jgi:hypothetical protein
VDPACADLPKYHGDMSFALNVVLEAHSTVSGFSDFTSFVACVALAITSETTPIKANR